MGQPLEHAQHAPSAAMERVLPNLIRWLIVLALPFALVLTTARLCFQDWYPRFEYAKASFPPDRYGWTQQQRLELVTVAIHYLNSPQPPEQAIEMLKVQRLPDSDSALYTNNELGHMLDVKRVVDVMWRIQTGALVLVIVGLALLFVRRSTRVIGWNALFGGGLLTVGLLVFLALFVVLSFQTFFVQFHEVLFPQGNWTFDYSDSLIRLLPEKLWYDGATLIVLGTLAEGAILAIVGYLFGRQAG